VSRFIWLGKAEEIAMGSNGQSWLVASEGEFRIRFWIIAIIFFGGFQLYAWDHVSAASALADLLARAGGNPHAMLTLIYSIGAAMVIAAAALRTWAAAYMSSSVVHDERVRDHRLVADGPYRHLRNPLYLGMILVALGIGLAASRGGFVLIAVAITFFQYRLTLREEAALLATQGESYRRYLATVPRMLPSLRPRIPASGAAAQWGQAIHGELFMWAYAAACVAFAVTGSTRVLMYGCIVATAMVPLTTWLGARGATKPLAQ
jgi:protein-S-isoprenylcysteine O-methyltransferase Ste14